MKDPVDIKGLLIRWLFQKKNFTQKLLKQTPPPGWFPLSLLAQETIQGVDRMDPSVGNAMGRTVPFGSLGVWCGDFF